VDVRIIAATNRDLEKEVHAGRFRQDLYYRLNVITIDIPPLRERAEDIPLLAAYFLNKYSEMNNKAMTGFSADVQTVLNTYSWPGNVRELENVIERAVSLCQTQYVTVPDLPLRLTQSSQPDPHLMIPMGISLDEIEQLVLEKTLLMTKGDKKAAARLLGISLSSLYNKLSRKE
jgi:two-component system response regulator HydG